MTMPTRDDLLDVVYEEAFLLDEGRFDEWLALFAPHGRYWMPLEPGQCDPHLVTSLLYEDIFMLRLRVERLKGARTFSQKPASRGHHLLQRPRICRFEPDEGRFATGHLVPLRGDPARRAGALRGMGAPRARDPGRRVADRPQAGRPRQLRRRVREHPALPLSTRRSRS